MRSRVARIVVRWRQVVLRLIAGGLAALVGGATVFYLAYYDAPVVAWVPRLLAWLRLRATFPGGADLVDWIAGRKPIELGVTTTGLILTFTLAWARAANRTVVRNDPPPPPRPPREDWMVDRTAATDEVVRLLRRRLGRSNPVALTALHGAGGFGKTTLATMVMWDRRVRRRFGRRIYAITLGPDVITPADVANKVNQLIRQITGEHESDTDPREASGRLATVLDERPRTLLVIDDVWKPEQLSPFLAGGRRTARLITTRVRSVLPGASAVTVDDMTDAEARMVLTRDLPELAPAQLDRLLRLTGRWALLLRLVNRAIVQQNGTGKDANQAAAQIADDLQTQGPTAAHLQGHAHPEPDAAFNHPDQRAKWVGATVEASTNLLPAGGDKRIAELGIFVADETIPLSLVVELWHATAQMNERASRALCAAMADLALISITGTNDGAMALHDEIRAYLRSRLGNDGLISTNTALISAVEQRLGPAETLAAGEPSPRAAWWTLADRERYLWDNAITHLLAANQLDQATALAGDVRWITARLAHAGLVEVGRDLSTVPSPLLRAKRAAYTRAAHLLNSADPPQMRVDTLTSRLRDEPIWAGQVAAFTDTLTRDRLTNRWPMPDAPEPHLIRVLAGHTGPVTGVAISADATMVASASADQTVRLWDPATGTVRATLAGRSRRAGRVWRVAISADGALVVTTRDRTVRLWSPATGALRAKLTSRHDPVWGVAISADGRQVAFSNVWTVRLWHPAVGRRLTLKGHAGPVSEVAISADGTLVASASSHTVRVSNLATGRRVTMEGHAGPVTGVAISADGSLVAAASGRTVRLWDSGTATVRADLTGHAEPISGVAISADGTLVAAASGRTVRLWDPTTATVRADLTGHAEPISGVAISADGSVVASASADQTVRLWDPTIGALPATLTDRSGLVRGVAVSADGTIVASASADGTVRLWDAATGTLRASLTGHTGLVRGVAVSADGALVASAGADRTVRLWDAASGALRMTLTDHPGPIWGVAFSADGSQIASASGRAVRLWDAVTGALRATLTSPFRLMRGVAISADGTLVASASGRVVRLWEPVSGARRATLTGHTGWVLGVAISTDGTMVASAGADGTVRLWDPATRALRATLTGHTSWVLGVAISTDATMVASASHDGTVRLWDAVTGQPTCGVRVNGPVNSIAWMPDTAGLMAAGQYGLYAFTLRTSRRDPTP